MRSKYECLWEGLPYVAMVAVVCFDVGLTTLSKAAMDKGASHFVFVVYSNALATLILLPSSFIFHRTKRHPLTLSLLCRFFTLALIGITLLQNSVFTGINYSSTTLGSALNNLTPAFTFILALLFSLVGAAIIVLGFYGVIWGQSKEARGNDKEVKVNDRVRPPSAENVPLLRNLREA
ncbi:hypothetical protein C5167_023486 [Papaver somniferum]|uniref:WAT1-related protein n=1 Tax=Papaver somniferum TaxID=3469 RepID=A0A4Y7JLT7_PAPSO|nr:hypothetical protein C5167_023486 [Papaver somniferum]